MTERVTRGGVWLVLGDVLARLAGTIKFAIVGRLLSPTDFGIMGIAMIVMVCLGYFTQTGMDAALVQKRGDIAPYLDTMWSIQLSRSILMAVVIYAAAPYGAMFFHGPGAVGVIRGAAVAVLLFGMMNPAAVYLKRELAFRQEVTMRASGALAGMLTAAALAWALRSVWALVISLVVARAVEVAMSYWVRPYPPRFHIDRDRAREMLRFGRWVLGTNLATFGVLYLDSIIIGRLLGPAALGIYQMAAQLGMLPISQLGMHVQGVLFPALSQVKGVEQQRRALLFAVRLLSAAVVPMALCGSLFSAPLVGLVLGPKWIAVCPVLATLVWAGAARALGGSAAPVFLAQGRPKLSFAAMVATGALITALVYPLLRWGGLTWAAGGVLASSGIVMVWQLAMGARLVGARFAEIVRALGGCIPGCGLFLAAHAATIAGPRHLTLLWVTAAACGQGMMILGSLRSLRRGTARIV